MLLDLSNNSLSGALPSSLGHCTSLVFINIGQNNFSGSIPVGLEKAKNLGYRDLTGNQFEGPFPSFIENLESLEYDTVHIYDSGIDLSLNPFTGNIPMELTLLKGLAMLNLPHNALTGEIPSKMGDMSGLKSLDLSFNNLSGEIPTSMDLLDALGVMNLSYNNFSGNIPPGRKLDIFYGDGSAYTGNKFLCGAPDAISCQSNVLSIDHEPTKVEHKRRQRLLLIGVVIVGYGVGFWGYFGVLYLIIKEQQRERYWRAIDKIVLKIISFLGK
ncbi:hypothetical protein GH714_025445 [Hevea brasiliensis]|uniref:Leucine-rich repeat-containing N-terminal plant-type domain-containing protein n=1 Tax=Hevea brasiliensis TaxID=3981 RepID=A0A6A6MQ70_HEVBR|nr:hypothetical protein GH714_025445 [Hevea brasiliensis]